MSRKSKKASGLGRGLSALLGEAHGQSADSVVQRALTGAHGEGVVAPGNDQASEDQPEDQGVGSRKTLNIPIEKIVANPNQPRQDFSEAALDELAASIREKGLLQPLLLRHKKDGNYEIIAGERRWRASQRVPLHEVPALIHNLNDSEAIEIALIENIQRQDLNPIEEAEGFNRLIANFDYTTEDVARLVSKSRSHVVNLIRLLDLPAKVQDFVRDGLLSMGHARAIINTPNPVELAHKAITQGLSVRQMEALVSSAKKPAAGKKKPRDLSAVDTDIEALENDLGDRLGMTVEIKDFGGRGNLTIRYQDLDQLDTLCAKLSNGSYE